MINSQITALSPHIELTPNPALVDQPVTIRLTGFAPDQRVTLQAQMLDEASQTWRSHATFQADALGRIDVSMQPPLAGSYTDVDGMGLFWSMTVVDDGKEPLFITKPRWTPTPMHFTATLEGQIVADAILERLFVAPDVTITPVREQGLVATLFRPAGAGPFPGVIVLGGSAGGITATESRAAPFAAHGYAALALAYFAIEHLPAALVNIPLEYFATAIDWLQAQAGVWADKLAVVGGSRGGELALLLGATFPQINAVVAYAPSSVIWGGFGSKEPDAPHHAWSYAGEPLPYLTQPKLAEPILGQEVVVQTPLWLPRLADPALVEETAIAVEKINGPILLISGQDDQMWPSARMAEMVMQRLTKHNHPHPYQHLSYARAGHIILAPYLPTTITQLRHPINGRVYAIGGNAKDSAFARVDSWARVLAFLAEHLGNPVQMGKHIHPCPHAGSQ